jgi:archaellum component FlaG (FlaF/FlaG flagellin family)
MKKVTRIFVLLALVFGLHTFAMAAEVQQERAENASAKSNETYSVLDDETTIRRQWKDGHKKVEFSIGRTGKEVAYLIDGAKVDSLTLAKLPPESIYGITVSSDEVHITTCSHLPAWKRKLREYFP